MAYRSYNRLLFLRLMLVVLTSLAIGWLFNSEVSRIIPVSLVLALIILLLELVRFLNKTNEQMTYFIQSIKNEDTTLRFPIKSGNSILNDLHKSLNDLNIILQETKVRSQIKEQYFSEIIQNIGTGIVVLNENGFVTEVNLAALELFGLNIFTHVKQLNRIDPKFCEALLKISNKQKLMVSLQKAKEQVQIVTRCSVINLKNENVKLITMQDIRGELERKEIDSWVKLIRVMSHEIMNSLAPVTSIAQSLIRIWKGKQQQTALIDDGDIESTINGLDVIGERGEALKRFVQSYRILTHVPQPDYKEVQIHAFLDSLSILLSPFKDENNIDIRFRYPEDDFEVSMDDQMLVQVIINLVKNSVEVLKNQNGAMVIISVNKTDNSQVKFQIEDNGSGIPEEILEQVFVPFFTTKEGGTGVGLSHSRQIVRAHGGTIQCNSKPGNTVFVIEI